MTFTGSQLLNREAAFVKNVVGYTCVGVHTIAQSMKLSWLWLLGSRSNWVHCKIHWGCSLLAVMEKDLGSLQVLLLFVCLFVWLVGSLVGSLVGWLVCSFVRSFVRLFVCLFVCICFDTKLHQWLISAGASTYPWLLTTSFSSPFPAESQRASSPSPDPGDEAMNRSGMAWGRMRPCGA